MQAAKSLCLIFEIIGGGQHTTLAMRNACSAS